MGPTLWRSFAFGLTEGTSSESHCMLGHHAWRLRGSCRIRVSSSLSAMLSMSDAINTSTVIALVPDLQVTS
jgi:hypothetical protein